MAHQGGKQNNGAATKRSFAHPKNDDVPISQSPDHLVSLSRSGPTIKKRRISSVFDAERSASLSKRILHADGPTPFPFMNYTISRDLTDEKRGTYDKIRLCALAGMQSATGTAACANQPEQPQTSRTEFQGFGDEQSPQQHDLGTACIISMSEIDTVVSRLKERRQAEEAFHEALREVCRIGTIIADGDVSRKVALHAKRVGSEVLPLKEKLDQLLKQFRVLSTQLEHMAMRRGVDHSTGLQTNVATLKRLYDDMLKELDRPR